ncbi:MAG: hypothetical protein H3C31_00690 [Brumimicrobium sp.]|nr:hypothetical protein [Brumimicrobium sp.]
MSNQREILATDNDIFESLYKDFLNANQGRVVMSHFGSSSQDFVYSLTEGLEQLMLNNGTPKNIIKRIFSIMIEELQNVRVHGEKNEQGKQIGHVMIKEYNGIYSISIGNLIKVENQKQLADYIQYLNSLNESEIKNVYLEILENGYIKNHEGAGLGFVTIKMKSKCNVQTQFIEYSKTLSYFEMRLSIMD